MVKDSGPNVEISLVINIKMTTETELARTFAEFWDRADGMAIWMGKSAVFDSKQNAEVYLKIIRNLDLIKKLTELQREESMTVELKLYISI